MTTIFLRRYDNYSSRVDSRQSFATSVFHDPPMERIYYVYILASRRNGTLYIGVTNNLENRVRLHKQGIGSKFTQGNTVSQDSSTSSNLTTSALPLRARRASRNTSARGK